MVNSAWSNVDVFGRFDQSAALKLARLGLFSLKNGNWPRPLWPSVKPDEASVTLRRARADGRVDKFAEVVER